MFEAQMKKLIVFMVIVIALAGCSRQRVRRDMPVDQRMAIANQYYDDGNYRKAIDYYTDVVFERRSIHTPLAQFRLAESYFNLRRYEDAIFEYRELIRLFPEFRNVNLAYFRIGESLFKQALNPHYCQQETVAAIDAFNIFLDRFPFDEKRDQAIDYLQKAQYNLLEKKFHNGYIYYKLYDYSASLLYLNEIIELGLRDELDKRSRYYAARIYIEWEDYERAQQMVDTLKEYYPDTSETNRVNRLFNRRF